MYFGLGYFNNQISLLVFLVSVVISKFGILQIYPIDRVPTGTGKPGIPGKMRQLFPVREKSGNFEKMSKSQGKVREF